MLVASSEEILRVFLQKELKTAGYEVLIAKDGIEALYLVNTFKMTKHPIDLYLIDSDLAKLNYISLIIKIMETKAHKPIILMTSDINIHIESNSATDPEIIFLKKPFTKDALFSLIHSYIKN